MQLMLFLTALMSSFSNQFSDDVKHTKDSYETIKKNIAAKKAVLVDVREKNEWDAGHLKQAKHIAWSKIRFASPRKKMQGLPDDELIIYCHCKAGVRALNAAKKLQKMGYEVRPILAGFDKLVENGFEAVEPKDNKKK
ncbi:rhodanese-like domain-containing protein [Mariniblastus sp.]|jgi:phage shock protein E|nr:rhodanese-like domain-containing protein [Mariniblastus sp.]MDB4756253.1 rhodanese-like domain-containing protein [Mariniblastus sp.]